MFFVLSNIAQDNFEEILKSYAIISEDYMDSSPLKSLVKFGSHFFNLFFGRLWRRPVFFV